MSYIRLLLIGITLLIGHLASAQEYVPGEVIVKFKSVRAASFSNKASGLGVNLHKSWDSIGVHQYKAKANSTDVNKLVEQFKKDPNVEFAEPNYIMRSLSVGEVNNVRSAGEARAERSAAVQNSNSLSKASNSAMTTSHYTQSDADVKIEETWAVLSSGTHYPVVAIIDSGVDYTHSVFVGAGAIWSNTDEVAGDGIDNDHNGYVDDVRGWDFHNDDNDPMDDNNHGTHVAGIVLGVGQDIFASPLAPAKIRIMPLKFLAADGSGSTSDAIEAIYYAIDNGASVINASWGGGGYSSSLLTAITAAYNANVSFVAAAGNAHSNNDSTPTYPANYESNNVISIAATTDYDSMASFSNYGKTTVHIASPGYEIDSTLPGNSYAEFSGTSMAAPLVAGTIALMEHETGTAINGYQARQILLASNDANVGNVAGKVISDARVNVYKAVSAAQSGVDGYQPPIARAPADAGSGGGGCGMVSTMMNESGGSGGGDLFGRALLMLFVLTPFAVAFALKQRRKEIENRREHQRYNISSEVRISIGEKELVGSVSTISMGGVKIDTDALLENGGIIEMNIMSPDGKEKIQVMGKVVWSAERKAYGVQFCDIAATQSSAIGQWTKNLVKSS